MKRLMAAALMAALAWSGGHPAAQSSDVAKILGQIKAADKDLLSVSEEDGRFLRVLLTASGTKRALEIGAANGYSSIWMGLALRDTGGHLTTIEYETLRLDGGAGAVFRGPFDATYDRVTGHWTLKARTGAEITRPLRLGLTLMLGGAVLRHGARRPAGRRHRRGRRHAARRQRKR